LPLADRFGCNDNIGMAFFSENKLRRFHIEIDDSALKSDSPEVQKRLDRIEENYEKLDEVLAGVEDLFQNDTSFMNLFPEGSEPDFDLPKKKKRKWRPRKPR
jgi:hypothetical protein